jgi:hypothetical protein
MQKNAHIQTLEKLQNSREELALVVNKQEQVLKMQLACIPGETLAAALFYVVPKKLEGKYSFKMINGIRNGLNKSMIKLVSKKEQPLTLTGNELVKRKVGWLPGAFKIYKLVKKYKLI